LSHTLAGLPGVHNELLGGHGDGTLIGGDARPVAQAHSGAIDCQDPRIVVHTSHHALRHDRLPGCRPISFHAVGY